MNVTTTQEMVVNPTVIKKLSGNSAFRIYLDTEYPTNGAMVATISLHALIPVSYTHLTLPTKIV